MPGVESAAEKAATYAEGRGFRVMVVVQHDVLMYRVQGLGAMRNNALMLGMEHEADFVVLLENDVELSEDSLYRLALASKPAVIPYFDQAFLSPGDRLQRVNFPCPVPNQGLVRIAWAASSFVMWSREALGLVGPRPYTDACILNEDEYNWRAWGLQGVRLWQDTNTVVKLLRPPSDMRKTGALCPARAAR